MQVAVLGSLEVRDDTGRVVELTGARLCALLIRLALDAPRPVGVSGQGGQDADCRGLAGAVRAEDAEHSAFGGGQVDAAQS